MSLAVDSCSLKVSPPSGAAIVAVCFVSIFFSKFHQKNPFVIQESKNNQFDQVWRLWVKEEVAVQLISHLHLKSLTAPVMVNQVRPIPLLSSRLAFPLENFYFWTLLPLELIIKVQCIQALSERMRREQQVSWSKGWWRVTDHWFCLYFSLSPMSLWKDGFFKRPLLYPTSY